MKNIACISAILIVVFVKNASSCEIKDWRWSNTSIESVKIEGSTTCKSGEIYIRAYDEKRFIGVAQTYIRGYTFITYVHRARVSSGKLMIRDHNEQDYVAVQGYAQVSCGF